MISWEPWIWNRYLSKNMKRNFVLKERKRIEGCFYFHLGVSPHPCTIRRCVISICCWARLIASHSTYRTVPTKKNWTLGIRIISKSKNRSIDHELIQTTCWKLVIHEDFIDYPLDVLPSFDVALANNEAIAARAFLFSRSLRYSGLLKGHNLLLRLRSNRDQGIGSWVAVTCV